MSIQTLEQFITEQQTHFPQAKGDFTKLLQAISLAAKIVHREVNKAGLADILGKLGNTNIQGEEQQKLDVFADHYFMDALEKVGECCYLASEEHEDGINLLKKNKYAVGKYMVYFDPLDGSSNIDANVSVGTIFSIYRRVSSEGDLQHIDFTQTGRKQVAAGYIIYGSSTMLVYSTGTGVNGFTLDPSIGEFCLSHPELKIPESGKTYSVNESNYNQFSMAIKQYLQFCKEIDQDTNRPYSSRYIGSLVADFHRNLIQGGIFLYPDTFQYPNGKLRLMYECNPLAFIAEQAGGKASTGDQCILDIIPHKLHQRTSLIIGSKNMVEKVEQFILEYSNMEHSFA
ncbi:class 1 fructose-bisphosphatase [Sphingobacterium endophyticum]|uniref:class 1 fructose-bisphosphatase n=1 Tax=Sphingobacterium endophyticum TaxID=2546448 RepID=UPI0012E12D21|nr:class 1 fructose-bisphosphatase [Sphingobacterium endophyticum]